MAELSLQYRAATDAEHKFTAQKLLAHSEEKLGMHIATEPFGLFVYEGGTMIGNIIGKIYCKWLHIDLIWVDESRRSQGIGTQLINEALQKAAELDLTGIEVWTQSWQAPEFYHKLGFKEFAVIEDFNPGHMRHAFRYFIKKKIA